MKKAAGCPLFLLYVCLFRTSALKYGDALLSSEDVFSGAAKDLREVCEHPRPTVQFKWDAMKAMAQALNEVGAAYNIHGGTVLGLARGCYIFDTDIDFAIERTWLESNVDDTISAILARGLHPRNTFGTYGTRGYERSFTYGLSQQDLEVERSQLKTMFEAHLRGSPGNIQLLHRQGMKVDLFTISRSPGSYEWGLWISGQFNPCTVKSTHTATFTWLGVDVKVPLPIKDALVSMYGRYYITPHRWTWDQEPFTIGSCRHSYLLVNSTSSRSRNSSEYDVDESEESSSETEVTKERDSTNRSQKSDRGADFWRNSTTRSEKSDRGAGNQTKVTKERDSTNRSQKSDRGAGSQTEDLSSNRKSMATAMGGGDGDSSTAKSQHLAAARTTLATAREAAAGAGRRLKAAEEGMATFQAELEHAKRAVAELEA